MKQNSIYKKALYLAVPMMIQNGITNAVSLVDNLMVGSLGTEKMTAVSIAGQLFFCILSCCIWRTVRSWYLQRAVFRTGK